MFMSLVAEDVEDKIHDVKRALGNVEILSDLSYSSRS